MAGRGSMQNTRSNRTMKERAIQRKAVATRVPRETGFGAGGVREGNTVKRFKGGPL